MQAHAISTRAWLGRGLGGYVSTYLELARCGQQRGKHDLCSNKPNVGPGRAVMLVLCVDQPPLHVRLSTPTPRLSARIQASTPSSSATLALARALAPIAALLAPSRRPTWRVAVQGKTRRKRSARERADGVLGQKKDTRTSNCACPVQGRPAARPAGITAGGFTLPAANGKFPFPSYSHTAGHNERSAQVQCVLYSSVHTESSVQST